MRILALESSCDETAAAVVENGRTVLANVVLSQIAAHRPYGGVVPEIACRAHLEEMSAIVAEALAQSKMTFSDLDGIAVTHGCGCCGPSNYFSERWPRCAGWPMALACREPTVRTSR